MKPVDLMKERERRCPICGREFWCTGEWVYKDANYPSRKYCSWKCLQKARASKLTLKDKMIQAIRDGLNDAEIKRLLGVTQKQITYRRQRMVVDDEQESHDQDGMRYLQFCQQNKKKDE